MPGLIRSNAAVENNRWVYLGYYLVQWYNLIRKYLSVSGDAGIFAAMFKSAMLVKMLLKMNAFMKLYRKIVYFSEPPKKLQMYYICTDQFSY